MTNSSRVGTKNLLNPNLTQVNIRRCAKCNITQADARIIRHHKGNDRFLGRRNSNIAKNYRKYYHCVNLCEECHAIIHVIYDAFIWPWQGHVEKQRSIRRLRLQYIKMCNRWLTTTTFDDRFNKNNIDVVHLLRKWHNANKRK